MFFSSQEKETFGSEYVSVFRGEKLEIPIRSRQRFGRMHNGNPASDNGIAFVSAKSSSGMDRSISSVYRAKNISRWDSTDWETSKELRLKI